MIYDNLDSADLINIALETENCSLTDDGVLVTYTGKHTGRSPDAKCFVNDNTVKNLVDWNRNKKMWKKDYNKNKKLFSKFAKSNNLFKQDVLLIRDTNHSIGFTIYTETAHHSLFVRNMFITQDQIVDAPQVSEIYEIFHFPSLLDEPMVAISVEDKKILISGTHYSGEIKKSAFTLVNLLLPETKNFLPMHCSVNVDSNNENPAIFFGLSGTGKTTLSAHPGRVLIGDDEHLWTDTGISNIEGGCYAKTISLSKDGEPEIWDACHSPGTMLENVVFNDNQLDFDDTTITENGRASYTTDVIASSHIMGYVNKHPKNIIMLTCDAFGILPPVSKLSPDEAIEQFLLGYTAKVAGTEEGIEEPQPTFSPCFGDPFMPLSPQRYADMLKEKINKHNVNCWLVNTGWTGGPHGVGKRIPLETTRKIIDLILTEQFSRVMFTRHKYTNFQVPLMKYASNNVMFPEHGWSRIDKYEEAAKKLMETIKSKK